MPLGVQPLSPRSSTAGTGKKKVTRKGAAPPKEYTAAENATLMQKLGGGAMSGLHVVGSVLNTPSRLLWGGVNAAQGGEGGWGNLNPLDSTGGIELSQFLANNEVIAPNDQNNWEILPSFEGGVFNPGDIGRGLIDLAGDPTSWFTPLGLTKAGQAAKVGAKGAAPLEKSLAAQFKSGQRGLVGFQPPLATKSYGAIGSDAGYRAISSADSMLSGAGVPSISKAVVESGPVRNMRAVRNYRFQGKTHPLLHNLMPDYTERLERLNQVVDEANTRWARDAEIDNAMSPAHRMEVRDWLEGVHPNQLQAEAAGTSPVLPPSLNQATIREMQDETSRRLSEGIASGVGVQGSLDDIVPIMHNGVALRDAQGNIRTKRLGFTDRRLSQGVINGQSLGSKSLQAKTPDVRGRKEVWEGNGYGTNGTNALTMDQRIWTPMKSVDQDLVGNEWVQSPAKIKAIANDIEIEKLSKGNMSPVTEGEISREIWRRKVNAGEDSIRQFWGEAVLPKWQTPAHKRAVRKAQSTLDSLNERLDRHRAALGLPHRDAATAQKYAGFPLETDPNLIKRRTNYVKSLERKGIPKAQKELDRATNDGVNRYREIAKKMVAVPELEKHGIFGNDVLYDSRMAGRAHARRQAAAPTIYEAIARGIQDTSADDRVVPVSKFLKTAGFHMDDDASRLSTASNISKIANISPDQVLDSRISQKLVDQLQSLTPNYRVPEAETNLSKGVRQVGAMYKANVLAMPSSRIRDITTAAADAVLRGHTTGRSHLDALSIMRGDVLSPERAAKYSQEARIQDWLNSRGLPPTPENTTEGLRQLLGVAFEHGLVKDIAPGQTGAHIGNMLEHVPGRYRQTSKQAANHFARTMLGLDRPDPKLIDWIDPRPENVFGATRTANPLLAASNQVAGAGDTMNRYAATLGQLEQGHGFDQAVAATKRSQVDYNPETFSPAETWSRRYLFPFMSYYSRKSADVAQELMEHPGGRTASLIKGVAKAHQADPSVPDDIASGLSIPIGTGSDGTKKYLTGFGMMHEQPVNLAGKFIGGNFAGGARELLGMTYPWIHSPVEIGTGTQLYTGEKLKNLDPPVGRILSNIGVAAGLRTEEQAKEPVRFPLSSQIEYALSKLPTSRTIGALRTLTDNSKDARTGEPHRSAGEKALQLLSGIRTQTVRPERQQKVLRKRMQDLAASLGAKEINDIYFTPEQMAAMKISNPQLAADIEQLRAGINSINRKSRATKKATRKEKANEKR